MKIAIIPARGGSKRIPRKNIKNFLGKPMIAYSIEAAKSSGLFEKVIVSTDSDEIADIARRYGAEVPFVRPAELADDYATSLDVVCHAIRELKAQNLSPDLVCMIYPTAPFVTKLLLSHALQLLESSGKQYCFPAVSYSCSVFRGFAIKAGTEIEMLWPEHELTRSQDLPDIYHDAGQFYWGRPQAFLDGVKIFSTNSVPMIVSRMMVQDIDTEEDWLEAEIKFRISHGDIK